MTVVRNWNVTAGIWTGYHRHFTASDKFHNQPAITSQSLAKPVDTLTVTVTSIFYIILDNIQIEMSSSYIIRSETLIYIWFASQCIWRAALWLRHEASLLFHCYSCDQIFSDAWREIVKTCYTFISSADKKATYHVVLLHHLSRTLSETAICSSHPTITRHGTATYLRPFQTSKHGGLYYCLQDH